MDIVEELRLEPLTRELCEKAAEEIERLRIGLIEARNTFEYYASHHSNKNPPDIEKARMNTALMKRCDDALNQR